VSSQPSGPDPAGAAPGASGELSEDELRAAYEAELNRITSAEVMLQAAVSLLNLGGRRLGLAPSGEGGAGATKDLAQVRDAIDGVRALLGVLERSAPTDLAPLRDALSQLQIAYAREAQAAAQPGGQDTGRGDSEQADREGSAAQARGGAGQQGAAQQGSGTHQPGPAESSGRLWVPGR
jgi:hypothetical protein